MNIKKILILVGVIFLTIILLGIIGKIKNPSSTPSNNNLLEYGSGDYDFSLEHDGLTRTYKVHVPTNYNSKIAAPVVINLHGGGGNADAARKASQMDASSDKYGFIVVYPEGTGKIILGKLVATWNSGRGSVQAIEDNIDDVDFIEKMLDDLEEKFNIDEKRIYSTGISNGALMSYRLACEMTDRIAAIAPIAGYDAYDNCNPSRPISVVHFHGTDDNLALYNGGQCGKHQIFKGNGWECSSVQDYISTWRTINKCPSKSSTTYQNGDAICETYGPCDKNTEVTLCTITDGGHTWPGGQLTNTQKWWTDIVGIVSQDISANDQMWEFFEKHPLE